MLAQQLETAIYASVSHTNNWGLGENAFQIAFEMFIKKTSGGCAHRLTGSPPTDVQSKWLFSLASKVFALWFVNGNLLCSPFYLYYTIMILEADSNLIIAFCKIYESLPGCRVLCWYRRYIYVERSRISERPQYLWWRQNKSREKIIILHCQFLCVVVSYLQLLFVLFYRIQCKLALGMIGL
jgi:hypothetical protein